MNERLSISAMRTKSSQLALYAALAFSLIFNRYGLISFIIFKFEFISIELFIVDVVLKIYVKNKVA